MLAATLTTVASFQMILLCKNDITLRTVVVIRGWIEVRFVKFWFVLFHHNAGSNLNNLLLNNSEIIKFIQHELLIFAK